MHDLYQIGYNREQIREMFGLLDFRSPQDLEDWLDVHASSHNGSETTDQDS